MAVTGLCEYTWGKMSLKGCFAVGLFESTCFRMIPNRFSELSLFLLVHRLWKERCTMDWTFSTSGAIMEAEV